MFGVCKYWPELEKKFLRLFSFFCKSKKIVRGSLSLIKQIVGRSSAEGIFRQDKQDLQDLQEEDMAWAFRRFFESVVQVLRLFSKQASAIAATLVLCCWRSEKPKKVNS